MSQQTIRPNSMNAWLIYLKERFPLPVYFLLSGGLVLSGAVLAYTEPFTWLTLLAFAFALWLFATLRLMDELKDYKKDLIAHPDRPLPRGLIKPDTVQVLIRLSMVKGLVISGLMYWVNPVAGLCALLSTLWLWLMYKEFYIGETLAKRPLLYAITHQIILIPFCLALSMRPQAYGGGINLKILLWAVGVLGAFFTYEVSRKLDPKAHPVLQTYLEVYGRGGSLAIVAGLFPLCVLAAMLLQLEIWLLPWSVLTLLCYGLLWISLPPGKVDKRHKLIEGFATLSLFFHIWTPILKYWLSMQVGE